MPGPIPRQEATLARPRERKGSNQQATTKGERRDVLWPPVPSEWGPLARGLYEGARDSGQADFYQQSDVAYLTFVLEEMNRYMEPITSRVYQDTGEVVQIYPKRSGQLFQALHSSMQSLLLTEGERRRVRIELMEKPVEKPHLASVARLQYADVAGDPTPDPEGD